MASASQRAKDLRLALAKELARTQKSIQNSIASTDQQEVGNATVLSMKALIAAGISPIEGKGRFPAYKAATGRNRGKGYPFNVDPFLNKKLRPVNLFLTGEFLDDLRCKVVGKQMQIGFFKKKSELKELGHREGANGQPKRPVIPVGKEKLNASVLRKLLESLDKVLKRKFGS